jgi:hypothetical protein
MLKSCNTQQTWSCIACRWSQSNFRAMNQSWKKNPEVSNMVTSSNGIMSKPLHHVGATMTISHNAQQQPCFQMQRMMVWVFISIAMSPWLNVDSELCSPESWGHAEPQWEGHQKPSPFLHGQRSSTCHSRWIWHSVILESNCQHLSLCAIVNEWITHPSKCISPAIAQTIGKRQSFRLLLCQNLPNSIWLGEIYLDMVAR